MPLQRDQPRAREKPRTALSVCQKSIVQKRKSSAANFLQVLLMLQCSSSKVMTTLMVGGAGRARNLQDVVFMVQRKGFGAGVVSGLRACVFLRTTEVLRYRAHVSGLCRDEQPRKTSCETIKHEKLLTVPQALFRRESVSL